jgi:hypothetical protein
MLIVDLIYRAMGVFSRRTGQETNLDSFLGATSWAHTLSFRNLSMRFKRSLHKSSQVKRKVMKGIKDRMSECAITF